MKYIIKQEDFFDLKGKLELWVKNIYQEKYYRKVKNWINKYLKLCENFYYQTDITLENLIKKYFKGSKRSFYIWAKKIINSYHEENYWKLCYKSTKPKTINYQFSKKIRKLICDYYYNYQMIGAGGVLSLYHNIKKGTFTNLDNEKVPKCILTFYRWIKEDQRFIKLQQQLKARKRDFKRYEVQEIGLIQMDAKVLTNNLFPLKDKRLYIYDFIDEKSRIVFGYVYKNLGINNAIDAVKRALIDFQNLKIKIKRIRTDNGSEFKISYSKSKSFSRFLAINNIKHELTPFCSPQSNGKIEAFHKNYKKIFYFKKYWFIKLEQKELQQCLNEWYFFYNFKRCHKSLQFKTPYETLVAIINQ